MSDEGTTTEPVAKDKPRRAQWRVVVSTANYVWADSSEEAAQKALNGFLNTLPANLRNADCWKVASVEPVPEGAE